LIEAKGKMGCKELKERCVFVWSGWSESSSVSVLFIEKDWISESEAKGMMQISRWVFLPLLPRLKEELGCVQLRDICEL